MKSSLLCATALTFLVPHAAAFEPGEAPEPQDARGDYRRLVKEYGAALAEFEAEVARLKETDVAEAEAYAESWRPAPAFVELFAEAAEKYAGTDDAVQFLT